MQTITGDLLQDSLLHLLYCALKEEKPALPTDLNWEALLQLANRQQVYNTVLPVLESAWLSLTNYNMMESGQWVERLSLNGAAAYPVCEQPATSRLCGFGGAEHSLYVLKGLGSAGALSPDHDAPNER